jgi:SAM-dependent methyltransferase
MSSQDTAFVTWFEALYRRHSQELTFQELRRSLTALSKIYTQGRDRLAAGAALTGRGKRAAFALFYGPLHYLLVRHAVDTLKLHLPKTDGPIVDLGCGTGVASAAWAKACPGDAPSVLGLDVSSWALQEARFNWQHLGLRGQARVARVHGGTLQQESNAQAVVAAFAVNELDDNCRAELLPSLLAAHRRGARVLIMEPIARSLTPWWPVWQQAFEAAGGQQTPLRLRLRLPERMALLSRAAGLDHQELTARCLSLPAPTLKESATHGAA